MAYFKISSKLLCLFTYPLGILVPSDYVLSVVADNSKVTNNITHKLEVSQPPT